MTIKGEVIFKNVFSWAIGFDPAPIQRREFSCGPLTISHRAATILFVVFLTLGLIGLDLYCSIYYYKYLPKFYVGLAIVEFLLAVLLAVGLVINDPSLLLPTQVWFSLNRAALLLGRYGLICLVVVISWMFAWKRLYLGEFSYHGNDCVCYSIILISASIPMTYLFRIYLEAIHRTRQGMMIKIEPEDTKKNMALPVLAVEAV